ncbi:aldo/keto reductase [[Eubacterium] hominis]|uniref:aldo/keto reductase n=1 Tax=[Eubacterium] hominis TaxID=2764325 RepID=UPI003A4E32A1
MKTITIKEKKAPALIQGCMRIPSLDDHQLEELIRVDLKHGINFFDHADIYGGGESEKAFGRVLKKNPELRDQMLIQSKCGIHQGEKITYYDFSKEYILSCVDQSLKNLETDHLDYLLLHRPDALMDPYEVNEAFDTLYKAGKVLHFGVSNQNPYQIELMKQGVNYPLEINQMQFSVMHTPMLDAGFNVNTKFENGIDRDNGLIEYCRVHDITIQCWSPFQYGMFEGVFLHNDKFPEVNKVIDDLAKKHQVTNSAIALAWLLTHPANMQVIVGTTNQHRIDELAHACEVKLTKEEWYHIYIAAGNLLP